MRDDKLYLIHISECIERVESYVAGGKAEFMSSSLIQDAVARNLQVMAESTQRLSDGAKMAHPEIDWREIAGFRNVLVHDYLDTDREILWQVIERDLPPLKAAMHAMLTSAHANGPAS
ncbi:MAG TPA: DUF86 domain-containing protein [Chloroflexia bacterium]